MKQTSPILMLGALICVDIVTCPCKANIKPETLTSLKTLVALMLKHNSWLITGRNEVVAKVMFLQVCVWPQGGRVSASVHAGMPDPPDQADPPGPSRHPPPPPDQADTQRTRQIPPQTRQTPPCRHPPGTRQTPPPRKQTPAYGLRAAGTHPAGMHSCVELKTVGKSKEFSCQSGRIFPSLILSLFLFTTSAIKLRSVSLHSLGMAY